MTLRIHSLLLAASLLAGCVTPALQQAGTSPSSPGAPAVASQPPRSAAHPDLPAASAGKPVEVVLPRPVLTAEKFRHDYGRMLLAGPHKGLYLVNGSPMAWGSNMGADLGIVNVISQGSGGVEVAVPRDIIRPPRKVQISGVVQLASGGMLTLFLRSDGQVWAAGRETSRRIGAGPGRELAVPTRLDGLSNILKVAGEGPYLFALDHFGRLHVWGAEIDSFSAQAREVPQPDAYIKVPQDLARVADIATNNRGYIALTLDGKVLVPRGQGSMSARVLDIPEPVTRIFGCSYCPDGYALGASGMMYAWGDRNSLLGNGVRLKGLLDRPVAVPELRGCHEVAKSGELGVAICAGSPGLMIWGNSHEAWLSTSWAGPVFDFPGKSPLVTWVPRLLPLKEKVNYVTLLHDTVVFETASGVYRLGGNTGIAELREAFMPYTKRPMPLPVPRRS